MPRPGPADYTDETPPAQDNPVAPARTPRPPKPRPPAGTIRPGSSTEAFAACSSTCPPLTRNQVRFTGTTATVAMLTEPTSTLRA